MFRRAQDRVRTYYYKTKEELLKANDLPQQQLQNLLVELQNRLKMTRFNGYLFDRRAAVGDAKLKALCDTGGLFRCQGRWNKERCLYNPEHSINPYTSREARIIFQTWNLDHKIERSRAVIPAIFLALRQTNGNDVGLRESDESDTVSQTGGGDVISDRSKLCIDVKRIYSDLFTTNNLKLVHIVCHDKGAHLTEKAGPYLVL